MIIHFNISLEKQKLVIKYKQNQFLVVLIIFFLPFNFLIFTLHLSLFHYPKKNPIVFYLHGFIYKILYFDFLILLHFKITTYILFRKIINQIYISH